MAQVGLIKMALNGIIKKNFIELINTLFEFSSIKISLLIFNIN